jgi:hypothetical protein
VAGRQRPARRTQPNTPRLVARPARYRVRLVHPDGHEEDGAVRRFRPAAPRLGHSFTTIEAGRPASWETFDERLAHDEQGEPYLDLRARRDFAESDGDLPDYELEHAREERFPEQAEALLARAEPSLQLELVALDPGEAPDWAEAGRYIESLVLEVVEDDLVELCGVDPDRDPRGTWLARVKERLGSDLERFRADVEGDHDEIEEWEYLCGRILATVGSLADEADPDSGHGWMCRLLDAGALAAAGFTRVRKAQLDVAGRGLM